MVFKKPTAVLALAGIAIASGVAWWYQNPRVTVNDSPSVAPAPAGQSNAPVPVEVTQVATMRLQDDAQAVGTLRSRQSVTLRPEVSGRVARIAFDEGARVRKGQLLIQLDDTLQKAELSQAQAQLSIARANLKRNQELVAERFVAQRVVDESQANLQVAEAQAALAEARLARMRLVAPFDATVGLRSVNVGDYVKDGADLVNLEDTSQLTVDFRLPERYQSRTEAGQRVLVQLDAMPGKDFEARILAVDPLIDANGRSLAVRAVMPPSSGDLRPGMFARVNIIFSVNDSAMMIPEEAVVPQGGRQFVVMLQSEGEGEGARLVSRRVEVKLGVRRGAQVEVLSGLKPGNTIVLAGQQRLQRDGTPVRVIDMSQAGGRPASPPGELKASAPSGNR
ncbi:MAG: rane fusion protein multidrug efflux system [Betaproteobacteria bacterium]|nr:rane fusion protein multidrug efflux system [Betaproteobacteria bacterium]